MMTDPIADMLTRIRNAAAVRKPEVILPYSKIKFSIARILKDAGYIDAVEKSAPKKGAGEEIRLALKYESEGKKSAVNFLGRISTPGRRVYVGYRELSDKGRKGRGLVILSTPKGLMTGKEARRQKLGGELICEIY